MAIGSQCCLPIVEMLHYKNERLERMIREELTTCQFYLYDASITDRDMEIIIKQGMINKQCTELYLGSNKLTAIGISILADALKDTNQILESLWLYDNQLGDTGVYFLAKVLSRSNRTLKTLDLGKNNITDNGMKYLAQMLATNRTLTHLYLSANQITDDGLGILAKTIRNSNAHLELLHISEHPLLTDVCVDSLLQMIRHNKSIKVVQMHQCNLSENGKTKLKTGQKGRNIFLL